ncbi:MAG TPA: ribosome maturation factor RimP [Methylomirabilota bacterium]|jgi:ribosome maturation factor RimP|nr:ribosome maturation factor RimP [Methylomirabilota bacterium]
MQDEERSAQIEEVIQPVLHDHGLELVDLEWRPRRPRAVLRVFIDKPGGVAIGDCERLSREVGDLLDVAGLIAESYDLEVSSPGLDRQLRTEREYRWATGKRVRCWLAGGAEVRGRLAEVVPECLVLEREGERVELPRAVVTKARLDAEVPWPRRGEG